MDIGHARIVVPLHKWTVVFSLCVVIFQRKLHIALRIGGSRTAERSAEAIPGVYFKAWVSQK